MTYIRIIIIFIICSVLMSCGKTGPLNLPEGKLDKSVITYPCDEACKKKFEEEKQRQKSVTIQTD